MFKSSLGSHFKSMISDFLFRSKTLSCICPVKKTWATWDLLHEWLPFSAWELLGKQDFLFVNSSRIKIVISLHLNLLFPLTLRIFTFSIHIKSFLYVLYISNCLLLFWSLIPCNSFPLVPMLEPSYWGSFIPLCFKKISFSLNLPLRILKCFFRSLFLKNRLLVNLWMMIPFSVHEPEAQKYFLILGKISWHVHCKV